MYPCCVQAYPVLAQRALVTRGAKKAFILHWQSTGRHTSPLQRASSWSAVCHSPQGACSRKTVTMPKVILPGESAGSPVSPRLCAGTFSLFKEGCLMVVLPECVFCCCFHKSVCFHGCVVIFTRFILNSTPLGIKISEERFQYLWIWYILMLYYGFWWLFAKYCLLCQSSTLMSV